MKKSILIIAFLSTFFSCKNETKQTEETANSNPVKEKTISDEPFEEGKIDVEIYFPDNPLSSVLNKIDPAKGDIQAQMETLSKNLTKADADKMEKAMKGNPMAGLQIVFAPLIENEIFVKGNMATAKCDGLMYHLENQLNGDDETGTVYLRSQANTDKEVSFKYDKDFFGQNQIQTKIDQEQFTRESTEETQIIAGYECKKTVYTSKVNNPMGIEGLVVWTSPKMPKSLNFVHPFYLEEDYGIMKINVHYSKDLSMVYEFKKVTSRTVTENEMAIQKTQPIYDSKTQEQELGLKMMEIMFGGK